MAYGPKRVKRARHNHAMQLVANAFLAGMKVEKHKTISRKWKGESHNAYSTTIDGVVIYRTSLASLARVYMNCMIEENADDGSNTTSNAA